MITKTIEIRSLSKSFRPFFSSNTRWNIWSQIEHQKIMYRQTIVRNIATFDRSKPHINIGTIGKDYYISIENSKYISL